MSSFGRRHLCFLGIKFLLAIIKQYINWRLPLSGCSSWRYSDGCFFCLFLFVFFGWGGRLFSSGCTFLITGCQPHSSVSFDGWSVIPFLWEMDVLDPVSPMVLMPKSGRGGGGGLKSCQTHVWYYPWWSSAPLCCEVIVSTDLTHGKSFLRRRDLGDLFCCTPLRFLPPDNVCKETGGVRVKDNQSSVTLVLSHHFIFTASSKWLELLPCWICITHAISHMGATIPKMGVTISHMGVTISDHISDGCLKVR